ncbi:MAG: Fe-S cluster assembly protein SufD [Anaerolineae bacterium]|nr:Fe-S cluster assembly protein SufD [Anaerolineae bacterium]
MNTAITHQQDTLPARGFTDQAFDGLVDGRGPDWLRERRRQAWRAYAELEPPKWRRTDLGKLDWGQLIPYAPPQAPVSDLAALPPKLHDALAAYGQRAGLLLQRDSAPVYLELAASVHAQGVIWTDLETAARDYPDLVRPYLLADAVSLSADKYTALHSAFWSGGAFLYVPRNVEVALPLISVLWQEMPQLAIFPHTLLVAEPGSRVTLVTELLSMGCDACPDTYHGGVTELHLGENAQVRYVNTQDFGRQVYDLNTQAAVLDRDSRLEWLSVILGGKLSRSSQHTFLRQPGAEALVTGLYLPDGKQHIAFDTLQDHIAANCTSDLLYQGALLGRSRSVYEGTIHAWPGAQKTNAYQNNRNLILSPKARADSLPRLEIENNDLRCTHGATVGQADEDQIFYLMSRGIPRNQALRLIVEGFFQPVLDRLPDSLSGLKQRLAYAMSLKIGA